MDRIEWPSYAPAQFKITQAVSIRLRVYHREGIANLFLCFEPLAGAMWT
jgi:hypothetical protein